MLTKDQRQVLGAREIVLQAIDGQKGTMADRMKAAEMQIRILAATMSTWIDNVALQYKQMGCTEEEWQEDIRSWLSSQQFFIDEDINDGSILRCHLSNMGMGRHVILTFNIGSGKNKRRRLQ
jgi:hypothetical protein